MHVWGPSITLYSLRQHQGRFYQLRVKSTVAFSPCWRARTTSTILSVLTTLIANKQEFAEMAALVTNAT